MQLAVRRVEFECVVGICTFSYLPTSRRFAHVAGEHALRPARGKYWKEAFSGRSAVLGLYLWYQNSKRKS